MDFSEELIRESLEQVFRDAGVERDSLSSGLAKALRSVLNAAHADDLSKRKTRVAIQLAMQAHGMAKDNKLGKLARAVYERIVEGHSKESSPKVKERTYSESISPYSVDMKSFRAYRYQHVPARHVAPNKDPIAELFVIIPNDALPFSNHPNFVDFYDKLDIVFKTFLRNFYVGVAGAPLITERIEAARRGVPKQFELSRISSIIQHGRDFARLWDQRFSGVLGRASAFFPIAESDVFVGGIEDYVTQIRNMLFLSASETRSEELVLLECSRIFKNVNHVRLLGPHDRFQDSLVVIAGMNHLLHLAIKIRNEVQGTQELWKKDMPCQNGYQGSIRLTLGELIKMMIVRGMDPDIYDAGKLTPRALIEEADYRPDALTKLARVVWPEGPDSALIQMFEGLPVEMHDDLDRLLVETFYIPHSEWAASPWFQSPYTGLTLGSAAQTFLNLLSVPFSQPLPLAEVAFFPIFKKDVVELLVERPTQFSHSLIGAMHPELKLIEEQTYFGMPDDYDREGIIFGPVHRRLTGPAFRYMPETYYTALSKLSRRKSFVRFQALLQDIGTDSVRELDDYLGLATLNSIDETSSPSQSDRVAQVTD